MKLKSIELKNFRNHVSTSIQCSTGINIFLGNNGEGKTNILEGISYSCLTKSFFAESDLLVLKFGEKVFTAEGIIVSDGGIEYEVCVEFDSTLNQKTIMVNHSKIEKASLLVGQFPLVILSPDQSAITHGTPAERRKFIDFIISQTSRKYLEGLIEYRKILRQRNKILSEISILREEHEELLDPWNIKLIQVGSQIIKKRKEFIEEFRVAFAETYKVLSGSHEQPGMLYVPSFDIKDGTSIEILFEQAIQNKFAEEKRAGFTLVGPQRDEVLFQINAMQAKEYASQGQHKTILVALKLAEFKYIKMQCHETPILLLDDVLSELDSERSERLLSTVTSVGQVFITSTEERALDRMLAQKSEKRKFFIKKGSVDHVENAISIN